jgi:hypothetical protein
MLLSNGGGDVESMSDKELEEEKDRLLSLLAEAQASEKVKKKKAPAKPRKKPSRKSK